MRRTLHKRTASRTLTGWLLIWVEPSVSCLPLFYKMIPLIVLFILFSIIFVVAILGKHLNLVWMRGSSAGHVSASFRASQRFPSHFTYPKQVYEVFCMNSNVVKCPSRTIEKQCRCAGTKIECESSGNRSPSQQYSHLFREKTCLFGRWYQFITSTKFRIWSELMNI